MDTTTAMQILGRSKSDRREERPVARGWQACGYTRADLDAAAAALGLTIRKVTGAKGSVLLCGSDE